MKNNIEKNRFEIEENGLVTFANYRTENKTLVINHVEAPVEARGTGSAGRLMQQVAQHAKDNGYNIVAVCGYAAAWLKRSPKYKDLVKG